MPNTAVPGLVGGFAGERVLRAPCDGEFRGVATIGDHVEEGQVVAYAGDVPVVATLTGVLRGLMADGVQVRQGLKCGDVDQMCIRDRQCCVPPGSQLDAEGFSWASLPSRRTG